jgi:hypothetical protein
MQFIAHELLYLYTFSKSTISKLRIILSALHFQSHPQSFGIIDIWRSLSVYSGLFV